MSLLLALSINILWGIPPILDSLVTRSIPHFGTIIASRVVVSVVLAILVALGVFVITRQQPFTTEPTMWKWLFASGISTMIGAGLYFLLLRYLSADGVAVLTSLYPVATVLLIAIWKNQSVHWTKLIALGLFGGALYLFFYGETLVRSAPQH